MALCTTDKCNLDGKYEGECALHCEKGSYQGDKHKGLIQEFCYSLIEHIYEQEVRCKGEMTEKYALEDIEKFMTKVSRPEALKDLINKTTLHFYNIYFPQYDLKDSIDYLKVLKNFKAVSFDNCHFNSGTLDVKDTGVFYQECTFINPLNIKDAKLLGDFSDVIYDSCTFLKGVDCTGYSLEETPVIENKLFKDCKFHNNVHFYGITINETIFNNEKDYEQVLGAISFDSCTFTDRFILNNANIEVLQIRDCEFKKKVELKNNNINKMKIINSNFEQLFDAYMSKFVNFKAERSIFDDFTGFEKCEFGIEGDEAKKKVEFEYVTFLNFTNFRKAIFHNGLDFEHTNLKEPPNFLNAKIAEKNTNRETYRIIKHSFEKIGNQLEANKYFSYEMKKYEEELQLKDTLSAEMAVFWLNNQISNFGSSVSRPLCLMISFAFMYYLTVLGYENNFLYRIFEPANTYINSFMTQINLFAKGIPPYGRFLKEGMEFVTLIFHICFLIVTWHFIVSVKRCTKR